MKQRILQGDCLQRMKETPSETYTAIVSDPPYGINYMSRKWDYDVPTVEHFKEMLRITKSGGYALIFGGSRTFHRIACNMEDAGWILKDTLMWIYASGFPKSLNISMEIDKKLDQEREIVGEIQLNGTARAGGKKTTSALESDGYVVSQSTQKITKPASKEAQDFHGMGTGLKPSFEPIILALKPHEKTYADTAIEHGHSGLNIDACRLGMGYDPVEVAEKESERIGGGIPRFDPNDHKMQKPRHPANIMHDGSSQAIRVFAGHERAFFCSKPNRHEKEKGCENLKSKKSHEVTNRKKGSKGANNPLSGARSKFDMKNTHPTVKPLKLMQYLCSLVKQPNDTSYILDPYCGSGTTIVACRSLNMRADGFELSEEYVTIAKARVGIQEDVDSWNGLYSVDQQLSLFD